MDLTELFLNVCSDGNLSAMENFLLSGISPNVQNAEGETALQISAANGFSDIVKLVLSKGAFVDLPNNYGWTPLMHAAKYGHYDIVSILIEMKAKINISNRLGLRPIDVAAWSGNLSCVELLIEAGAIIDCLPFSGIQNDICDISPLMAASLRGHDFVVRYLLENKSLVNQASPITGLTPLMLAACNGFKNIVEILIEFGGDANKTDKYGRTALDLAVICSRKDAIAFLEEFTQPNLRKSSGGALNDVNIVRIVRSGNIGQVKSLLLQNQSLCNYSDPTDGVTPLMVASMLGYNNIVDVLIINGANLNAQDVTNGWTPLMYAVFHRQAETVHLLLDKGVNVDICTANGYTAIDLAIHTDSSETDILGILLAYNKSQEIPDPLDYSAFPLSSTIKRSHLAVEKNERVSSRGDSQGKFKDLIGGLSSHLRQFSKSSTLSPAIDSEIFDETLYDVFEEEDVQQTGKFLCISKFYAPNERFAHLLKEQEVEAIYLPPLPSHAGLIDADKALCLRKEKATKNKSSKPCFNSLHTPNLLKKWLGKGPPASSSQLPENYVLSDSLDSQDINGLSTRSLVALKLNSALPSKEFDFKEGNINVADQDSNGSTLKDCEDLVKKSQKEFDEGLRIKIDLKKESSNIAETAAGGLTALLSQESLKKYAEKFRDQEIDLETFQYLTEDDLNEIGINSFESRNKLMEIIGKLKKS